MRRFSDRVETVASGRLRLMSANSHGHCLTSPLQWHTRCSIYHQQVRRTMATTLLLALAIILPPVASGAVIEERGEFLWFGFSLSLMSRALLSNCFLIAPRWHLFSFSCLLFVSLYVHECLFCCSVAELSMGTVARTHRCAHLTHWRTSPTCS